MILPKGIGRHNVLDYFPCFGHFDKINCMNLGFLQFKRNAMGVLGCEHCPLERICKQDSLKYMRAPDVYESGQIDRPRDLIRKLEKR